MTTTKVTYTLGQDEINVILGALRLIQRHADNPCKEMVPEEIYEIVQDSLEYVDIDELCADINLGGTSV